MIALAGLFSACTQEHIEAIYNPDKVTPQQMGGVEGCELSADGADIQLTFTPAVFGNGLLANYTLYMDTVATLIQAGKLSATFDEKAGTATFTQKDLNAALLNRGAEPGVACPVFFYIESALKTDKNASVEGSEIMSNVVSANFIPYNAEIRDVDKYPHAWVIGASSAVGAWSFDKVHQYLYDYKGNGTYTGLIDFGEDGPSGGFKLTGVGNWDDPTKNWGSEAQAEEAEVAVVQLIAGNGSKDIKCYSHRYYFFSFVESTLALTAATTFDNIGIVGSFNEWNAADENMKMTFNDYYHRFYIDMTFSQDCELKFTCDDKWDLNWGKDCEPGGANIQVSSGSYRIYFDLNTRTYDFNTRMFGQEEPGAPVVPEPPVTYEGWGIIGDFNEWAADVPMTEKDGVWTGYINVTETQGWKLRKDAGWDENVGGTFTALGTAFTAEAGGANICLGQDGFFKVVYDTNEGTITVYDGNVWSLIGGFNDWAGDVDMEQVDGLWVAKEVALSGEWKLRHNHDWADNRGGKFAEFGTPFEVTNGGDNIDCGEGKFNITYDPNNETVTIENAAKTWGVIGAFTGWSDDVVMTEVAPGIWVSPKTTIAEQGWKVRFDKDWTVNYGGTTPTKVGQFVQAVGNGDNINMTGDLIIVLNLNNGTLGTLGWGVTGSIASCPGIAWSNDIPMNLTSDSTWVSSPIALTTDDEIKIRYGAGWDQNFGGTCVGIDSTFAAVAGGDNIKVPANGTYVIAYNPAVGELCVTSAVCGLIGDFNSWSADDFMFYGGQGKFYAFNRNYQGGWKIRMDAGWTVNRGGNYEFNKPFAVTQDGPNITVEEGVAAAGFHVIYDAVNETVTINQTLIF